jgi:uncharacterized Tic20 family protein
VTQENNYVPPPPPPPPQPGAYDPAAAAGAPPGPPPVGVPMSYQTPTGYPGAYDGPEPDQDSKTMALLAHLLGILLGIIGPLIIWLMKKDTSPFVNDQGKEAMNFQIVLLLGYLVGGFTTFLCIGVIILPLVWLGGIVFSILAAMKANQGIAYRYPFNIRLIK